MNLYDGEIYKTRNLRNQSLMQQHPEPEALAHAQDSIQRRLTSFEEKLWVPSLEELEKRREAKEAAEAAAAANAEDSENAESAEASAPSEKKVSSRSKRGTKRSSDKADKKKPSLRRSNAPKNRRAQAAPAPRRASETDANADPKQKSALCLQKTAKKFCQAKNNA